METTPSSASSSGSRRRSLEESPSPTPTAARRSRRVITDECPDDDAPPRDDDGNSQNSQTGDDDLAAAAAADASPVRERVYTVRVVQGDGIHISMDYDGGGGKKAPWIAAGASSSSAAAADAAHGRQRALPPAIHAASAADDVNDDDNGAGCATSRSGKGEKQYEEAVPPSVLQYERQMRKIQASDRAGAPVNAAEHLKPLHVDEHVIVVDKPSGVLCVPGINHNPSILGLVHDVYGCRNDDGEGMTMDRMIVHRLDMDTSGVVVFARTKGALKALHASFRDRKVDKTYEALLCGTVSTNEGLIDLPLQRDHRFPPFMRVATPASEREAASVVQDLRHAGWKKIVAKKPKPSRTRFKVLSREWYGGIKTLPVTRVALTPVTGRTHQLRVHCAAMGHPIVADPAYGIYGETSPNGGLEECLMDDMMPGRASLTLQRDINAKVREEGRTMCLHARKLGLDHPATGKPVIFEAPPPF